jgi:predicted DNA-binding protein
MPVSTIVRISRNAKRILEDLAERSGETMSEILNRAIEEYRRNEFLRETNIAYAELRRDKSKSNAFDTELSSLETTLMDGLDPNETWDEPGNQKKMKKRRK